MAQNISLKSITFNNNLDHFKPSEVVSRLDQYIIGQAKAKRMVALALRNRIRRRFVEAELRDEISPKNILMIGPTGVGKTEIARRLAQLVDAPFVKVEATKFTERGYVGRDVEHMIRSLVNHSVNLVKSRMREQVKDEVSVAVEKILWKRVWGKISRKLLYDSESVLTPSAKRARKTTAKKDFEKGAYDDLVISISIKKKNINIFPMVDMFPGMEDMESNLQSLFGGDLSPVQEEEKEMTIEEAREALTQQKTEESIDLDTAIELGLKWAQDMGIIFIDEIDKICGGAGGQGPDISREGVQRDLLPLVEGSTVNTKYGVIKTDHILFIAAGAFHVAKPSDLIPELQGRFPIRVELFSLNQQDLRRILSEPKNALIKQYQALLKTEGLELSFSDDALDRIVELAYEINRNVEDIGARRLHTIMEFLLEDISFTAPDLNKKKMNVDKAYVDERLKEMENNRDFSRYIL